jgi:hypothetical protein
MTGGSTYMDLKITELQIKQVENALKKQIPQEVLEYINIHNGDRSWQCPICNNFFPPTGNYCRCCGQKLEKGGN